MYACDVLLVVSEVRDDGSTRWILPGNDLLRHEITFYDVVCIEDAGFNKKSDMCRVSDSIVDVM